MKDFQSVEYCCLLCGPENNFGDPEQRTKDIPNFDAWISDIRFHICIQHGPMRPEEEINSFLIALYL